MKQKLLASRETKTRLNFQSWILGVKFTDGTSDEHSRISFTGTFSIVAVSLF